MLQSNKLQKDKISKGDLQGKLAESLSFEGTPGKAYEKPVANKPVSIQVYGSNVAPHNHMDMQQVVQCNKAFLLTVLDMLLMVIITLHPQQLLILVMCTTRFQPPPIQPGYDQSNPHTIAYESALVLAGYGRDLSPHPGYKQYDFSHMYAAPW
ncbi:hypothetical protein ACH5RR_026079 [Cinchona calisaya]|uniref:Uncharacterized protein n=1 Tax=Cinchona calisaya TaxID=153742 RepID=A0ABD2Z5H5_9GENT